MVVLTDESLCQSPWLEYTVSKHLAEMLCDQLQIINISEDTLQSTKNSHSPSRTMGWW